MSNMSNMSNTTVQCCKCTALYDNALQYGAYDKSHNGLFICNLCRFNECAGDTGPMLFKNAVTNGIIISLPARTTENLHKPETYETVAEYLVHADPWWYIAYSQHQWTSHDILTTDNHYFFNRIKEIEDESIRSWIMQLNASKLVERLNHHLIRLFSISSYHVH